MGDEGIKRTLKRCWEENKYLLCPHTAVAAAYHYAQLDKGYSLHISLQPYTVLQRCPPHFSTAIHCAAKMSSTFLYSHTLCCKDVLHISLQPYTVLQRCPPHFSTAIHCAAKMSSTFLYSHTLCCKDVLHISLQPYTVLQRCPPHFSTAIHCAAKGDFKFIYPD